MSKILHLTFLTSLFLIFLLPPTDPDLGWHLRCGQELWQGQGFCSQNHFTVLLENYSWPNHAWGYQAVIYPIFKFFGLYGLTVFNALLMTAAFWFLFAAIKNYTLEKMLGILATIYFGWGVFSFGLRSQLVGFFFFNLTLYLLTKLPTKSRPDKVQQRPLFEFVSRPHNTPITNKTPIHHHNKVTQRPLFQFVIPLVMLLWANTHGSVILGLILVGCSILTTVVVNLGRPYILKTLTPLALGSAAVTLINPFGFRIYEEAWRHFAGPIDLSKLIAEWVPPQPHIQQIILISGALVLAYLLFKYLTAPSSFILNSLFLILPFAFWALRARRNVPFFFAITSFSLLNALPVKEESPVKKQLAGLLATGILLYGLLIQLPQTIETNNSWQNYCQNKSLELPCDAVEFLKSQPVGNIFNRYEWGGFLIWQLPDYKIFVDGRMPAWSPEALAKGDSPVSPYTIYLETLQTRPGWQETLDQYSITYILISPNTFMDLKLQPNPSEFGWQEVYRDKIAVVYKKLSTGN